MLIQSKVSLSGGRGEIKLILPSSAPAIKTGTTWLSLANRAGKIFTPLGSIAGSSKIVNPVAWDSWLSNAASVIFNCWASTLKRFSREASLIKPSATSLSWPIRRAGNPWRVANDINYLVTDSAGDGLITLLTSSAIGVALIRFSALILSTAELFRT